MLLLLLKAVRAVAVMLQRNKTSHPPLLMICLLMN